MKERPILMNAPMVRATLDGSKTQTRRVVTGQALEWLYIAKFDASFVSMAENALCKYGLAGDRLWVRETFWAFGRWETRFSEKKGRDEWHFIDMTAAMDRLYQFADPTSESRRHRSSITPAWWKRPAIFMPRAASRITLEVTGVRVERLNDCSEADAIAEGIEPNWIGDLTAGPNGFGGQGWVPDCGWCHYTNSIDGDPAYTPVESYRSLWESINGPGSWSANPWVWVVEFKRVEAMKLAA